MNGCLTVDEDVEFLNWFFEWEIKKSRNGKGERWEDVVNLKDRRDELNRLVLWISLLLFRSIQRSRSKVICNCVVKSWRWDKSIALRVPRFCTCFLIPLMPESQNLDEFEGLKAPTFRIWCKPIPLEFFCTIPWHYMVQFDHAMSSMSLSKLHQVYIVLFCCFDKLERKWLCQNSIGLLKHFQTSRLKGFQ